MVSLPAPRLLVVARPLAHAGILRWLAAAQDIGYSADLLSLWKARGAPRKETCRRTWRGES